MTAPKAPTIVMQPAPVNTATAAAEIADTQEKARKAAQKALGRSKTMLSTSDVNTVTGEATQSLLGGNG